MVTFLLTLAVFALVVTAMAVGAMVTGRRLSGSCGGVQGASCTCSSERQAECKKDGPPNADVPIEVAALTRPSRRS